MSCIVVFDAPWAGGGSRSLPRQPCDENPCSVRGVDLSQSVPILGAIADPQPAGATPLSAKLSRATRTVMDVQQGVTIRPCNGKTELFFGRAGEGSSRRDARELEAKALCRGCEDAPACLARAMKRAEPAGIWGGLTTEERELVAEAQRTNGWRIPDTEAS